MISATLDLFIGPFLKRMDEVKERLRDLAHIAGIFQGATLFGQEAFEGLEEGMEKIHALFEMGAQLKETSLASGDSIRDIAILDQAFQNAGLGAEAAQPMIAKFQKALNGVNEEGLPTNHALERLGLNVAGFRDLPAIEQFKRLQQSLEQVHDPVERTNLAMELFGRTGAKMLSLLSNGEAFGEAEDQVGGFADEMQKSAGVFHELGNAITTLGQKSREVLSGVFGELGPGLKSFLDPLTKTDLTGWGEKLGGAASSVAQFVRALAPLKPLLEAVAIQFAFGLSGEKVTSMLQALRNQLTGLFQAIKNPSEAWRGLQMLMAQAPPGSGFLGKASALLKGMLSETLAVTAAVTALIWAWNHYQDRRAAVALTAFGGVDKELGRQSASDIDEMAGLHNPEGKSEVIKKLNAQIAELHEKIASVGEDFASLGTSPEADGERAKITARYQEQIFLLLRLSEHTLKLTDAQMAANAAHRAAAAAAAEEAAEVAKLVDLYGKLHAEYHDAVSKSWFDRLTPDQQEKELDRQDKDLLKESGAPDSATLNMEVFQDHQKIEAGAMKDPAELEVASRRLEILKQMMDVEDRLAKAKDRQSEKDKEAAEKTVEAARRRVDFERKSQLDIAKLQAEGRGDKKEEDRLDRQERYDKYFEEATNAGEGVMQADTLARQKIAAEDQAKAEKEKEKGDRDDKVTVISDQDRRVGLGGFATAQRTDPLVKAHRDSAKAMKDLGGKLDGLTKQLANPPPRPPEHPIKIVLG
jgi:hypothetical protein